MLRQGAGGRRIVTGVLEPALAKLAQEPNQHNHLVKEPKLLNNL
jgi:hypothetical protein